MRLRFVLVLATSTTALGGLAAGGCNVVLGNEEGTLRVTADAGTTEAGGQLACPNGYKDCFGLCVQTDQVTTGCADPASCVACDPKNAEGLKCNGTPNGYVCAYDKCADGFASCDGDESNGCEASLNGAANCGGCKNPCEGATPFCAPEGGSYACKATCPADTTQCGQECVDTKTSLDHCGGCDSPCRRPSATGKCADGTCNYECNSGTHECSGACVSDLDPSTCGKSCTPCPAADPAKHQVSTCEKGSCGVTCEPGWRDCNKTTLADDGCETQGEKCLDTGLCGGSICLPGQTCCSNRCVTENDGLCPSPPASP